MLIALLNFVLWIPAILGWGSLAVPVRRALGEPQPSRFDLFDIFLGFSLLAALSIILNFVFPVQWWLSLAVAIPGYIFFWRRFHNTLKVKENPWLSTSFTIWFALPLIRSLVQTWFVDDGIYHIQTVKWIHEFPITIGLVNLQGRFGFNSSWLSIAALLQPVFTTDPNPGIFASNALLVTLFGICVYYFGIIPFIKKQYRISSTFMFFVAILIISPPVTDRINSLETDLPVFFLSLGCTYYAILAMERRVSLTYGLFACSAIAAFALTVKLSSAALFLLPAFLLLARLKIQLRPETTGRATGKSRLSGISTSALPGFTKFIKLFGLFAAVLWIPWLLRSVLLSGCLAYPVSGTCLQAFPWTVSPVQLAGDLANILSWARSHADVPYAQVLATWDWFKPWLSTNLPPLSPTIALTILGLLSLAIARRKPDQGGDFNILWIFIPLLLNITFWLFSAPDLRFGLGIFWSVSLLMISIIINPILLRLESVLKLQQLLYILKLTLVGLFLAGASFNIGLRQYPFLSVQLTPASEHLLSLTPFNTIDLQVYRSENGVIVYKSAQDELCWDAPLPCTQFQVDHLSIEKVGAWTYITISH